jgi:hypothetical protein
MTMPMLPDGPVASSRDAGPGARADALDRLARSGRAAVHDLDPV